MRRTLFSILLMLLLGLMACSQPAIVEPATVSSEPGVVTVFKAPT